MTSNSLDIKEHAVLQELVHNKWPVQMSQQIATVTAIGLHLYKDNKNGNDKMHSVCTDIHIYILGQQRKLSVLTVDTVA